MKFLKAVCNDLCGLDYSLADLSDIDLLNTIQNLTEEVTLAWAQGIPVYKVGKTDIEFAKADLVASLTRELQNRLLEKELELDMFYRLVTSNTKKVITGILTQRYREETSRKEWALVSKATKEGSRKILYWFGAEKPSEEMVQKQEKRVQQFKHAKVPW